MDITMDAGGGKMVGSKIRLAGRVLGLSLCVDEVVSEYVPPQRKVWETLGEPRLLVIGRYRMGFDIAPTKKGALFRVFIHYDLPHAAPARWLGLLLAKYYAKWCIQHMLADTSKHFTE